MKKRSEILIVEDSSTQASHLQHLLETRGYEVRIATNGAEALRLAGEREPDLILADIDMPVMDGYAMCRHFKGEANLRTIPVILLTSLTDTGDVLRGLTAAADYYLTKPYQPEYLLSRVEEILANPRPDGAPSTAPPIEIVLNKSKHLITADRRQILGLLLSTYSDAVQRTKELMRSEQELNRQNQLLDKTVQAERHAMEQLKTAQAQLVQSEKMAGLGQMVAGIAHEINNPLAFVINNLAVIDRDLLGMCKILELYQKTDVALAGRDDLLKPIQEFSARIDLPYTIENLNDVIKSSREGLERVRKIVADLRDFVRLDQNNLTEVDLNVGITSTVNILRPKAHSQKVTLELELAELPKVSCYPAKINQVIMNLAANAIDATPAGGWVMVRSAADGNFVRIEVIDNGSGIDPAIRTKIFDPFFTTKPPGKGTGLGLSISYGIIRDHGGRIDVESEPGKGAKFVVMIPLRSSTPKE